MVNPKYIFIAIIATAILVAYFILAFSAVLYFQQSEPEEKVVIQGNSFVAISNVCYPELKVYATITAYNPTEAQCDSTPDIMASGARVYEGAIACPRELAFGTSVEIDGVIYTCEDRTAKKYNGRYDILMFSYEEAIEWGRQEKEVLIY